MTGRKRKALFVAKQRKEMVGDLEKVQYDDVVETAIERLQAGPHLGYWDFTTVLTSSKRDARPSRCRTDSLRASRTRVPILGPAVQAEDRANCFAAKRGDLRGVSTGGTNVPFGFSGVDDSRETYPAALANIVFSLPAIGESMTSYIKIVRVHAKNSNRATVGKFSNFNLSRGRFPLQLSYAFLTSLCAPECSNNSLVVCINICSQILVILYFVRLGVY